jgi:hypothetical protein
MVDSVICGRVGCAEPAVSVLLIAPQDQQAWLVGPDHEAARDGVPLCAAHADRVTVPFGWQLRDDRPVAKPRARRKSRSRKATPEPLPEAPATESEPVAETATRPSPPTRRSAATEPEAQSSAPQSEPAQPVADAEPAPAAAAPTEPPVAESPAIAVEATTPAEPEPEPEVAFEADPSSDDAGTADEARTVDDVATSTGASTAGAATGAEPAKQERLHSPADVPVLADDVAAAVAGSGARLTVVPGDDDPSKTFSVEPDGQTALWAESQRDDHEPSDETPLLKRAFRVVRED